MKHHSIQTLMLVVAVSLSPNTVQAEETLSRPMNADGRLMIEASNGTFRISGSDSGQVHISSSESLGNGVQIEGDEDQWRLRFPALSNPSATIVDISLPATAELEARVDEASLTVHGLHGPRLTLQSISGPIRVKDSQPRRLSVETVDGPLSLNSLGTIESRIHSMGGAIDAAGTSDRARLRTVSGPVRLHLEAFSDLDLESLSGTLDARLEPRDNAVIRAHSHSGAQRLDLPASSGLDLRAESHLGNISSDFGGEASTGHSSNRRLAHRSGNGSVRAELRSVDGPIEVRASQPTARALVFRDPSRTRAPRTYRQASEQHNPATVDRDIEIGYDESVTASLSPGQYVIFDLPLDSRKLFARHSELDLLVELEVLELNTTLYCFYISRTEGWAGTWDIFRHQVGFELAHVPCPQADELNEFEQVSSGGSANPAI